MLCAVAFGPAWCFLRVAALLLLALWLELVFRPVVRAEVFFFPVAAGLFLEDAFLPDVFLVLE